MKLFSITDPITRKRLARFRSIRRAHLSLWILAALYLMSLAAELICNDRPLYVRHEGKSYFPVFKFYPEKTFVAGGRDTRPNYKALATSPAFAADTRNTMVFPPIRFGPLESINPESLADERRVTLTIRRIPYVGNVNVDEDLVIKRSREAEHFFGQEPPGGLTLTDHWPLDDGFKQAIAQRFRNAESGATSVTLASSVDSSQTAVLSMSKFKPRRKAPSSVRIILREEGSRDDSESVLSFDHNSQMQNEPSSLWTALSEAQRQNLLALVQRRFDEPVFPDPLDLDGSPHAVDITLEDIAWPYRPVRGHCLGIDDSGRDVLTRLLYGLRISMSFGFALVLVSMVIGIIVGAIQGYFGGITDITGQRLIEIWSAIPFLYVMILLGSVFGRSFGLLLFCYGIFNWIGISYYMRAEFLRLRGQAYVDAARCLGVGPQRIMFRHIFPNAITPVITFFPFSLVGAIGSLAALDYLGFGLPPPTPSWGEMLQQAQEIRWAWWLILYPSLALFVVMLLGVFVGEGVREAFDPRKYAKLQ